MVQVREAREAYYRDKKVISLSKLAEFDIREDETTGELMFRGFACITDRSYEVYDWLGEYDETVRRGAFAKALQEEDDTRLLVNHAGVPLARTKSSTLTLREIVDPLDDPQGKGQTGLWCEAPLDRSNPTVQEIQSAMKRGDLSEMSFGFMATRQEWNEDWTERTILELRLFDVSVVTYPANPHTSATLDDGRGATRASVFSAIRAGLPFNEEQRDFVLEAIEQRDALISVNITVTQTETEYESEVEAEEEDDDMMSGERALVLARFESARVDSH